MRTLPRSGSWPLLAMDVNDHESFQDQICLENEPDFKFEIKKAKKAKSLEKANQRKRTIEKVPAGVAALIDFGAGGGAKGRHPVSSLFQHYYPEGGWGWVVLVGATAVHALASGMQMSFGILDIHIRRRFLVGPATDWSVCFLGSTSLFVSFVMSPIIVGFCKRKSTRLTAVVGGLILALGCLFTSFASKLHQNFISYAIMLGLGCGLVRESSSLMVAQYFKKKRATVETVLVAGTGLGIVLMSVLLEHSIIINGWRIGLQMITILLAVTIIIGTFYRSASLYHPQRRAILHLKSQKRKIKNKDKEKNKAQDDRPPYFDFKCLKSRTVKILLCSVFIMSFGVLNPVFLFAREAVKHHVPPDHLISLYVQLGLGWCLGCLIWGILINSHSKECHISRQNLCQIALLLHTCSSFALTSVTEYKGYVMFVWLHGTFLGGFSYSLKMYVYQKVRARNFARAWAFLQGTMAFPVLLGIPVSDYLNDTFGSQAGFYFSGSFTLLGSVVMFLITVHKSVLRKKRRNSKPVTESAGNQRKLAPTPSYQMNGNFPSDIQGHHSSSSSTDLANGVSYFISQNGLHLMLDLSSSSSSYGLRPVLGNSRSWSKNPSSVECKPVGLPQSASSDSSDDDEEPEGLHGLPDLLLFEDMALVDNITSCNKVENELVLSEYEQNLIKEIEAPGMSRSRKRRAQNSDEKTRNGDEDQLFCQCHQLDEATPRRVKDISSSSKLRALMSVQRPISVIEEVSI